MTNCVRKEQGEGLEETRGRKGREGDPVCIYKFSLVSITYVRCCCLMCHVYRGRCRCGRTSSTKLANCIRVCGQYLEFTLFNFNFKFSDEICKPPQLSVTSKNAVQ